MRLDTMHGLRPYIDHFTSLGQSAKCAHILVHGHVVVLDLGRPGLEGLCLHMVTDVLEILLDLGCELYDVHQNCQQRYG